MEKWKILQFTGFKLATANYRPFALRLTPFFNSISKETLLLHDQS
jgi:hypothetical protein